MENKISIIRFCSLLNADNILMYYAWFALDCAVVYHRQE